MKFREAAISDAEAIAALHAASWQSTYARVLQERYLRDVVPLERKAAWQQRLLEPRSNQKVLVAVKSDQVVGFVCAFIDEHPVMGSYLENLHVASQEHGGGFGTQLVQTIASVCCMQAQSTKLYLSVNQDNIRAQRFYLGLGATNAAEAVWNAPDGSAVSTYRFEWSSVFELAERAANPSFQRTAYGSR